MGLIASSSSNTSYTNASFDKGIGKFVLDSDREAIKAIKASIGYEDKHGYHTATASQMLAMMKEQNIATFGGASGELEGVELFEKDVARYYKVRLSETNGEGKKEFTTLTMSISNTGNRNNSHVAGVIASLDQLKKGDNVDIGLWMAQAKGQDGKPVLTRGGDEIYNAASIVKKDGEKVDIKGKTLITKDTFAAKREALAQAGLDKEQVGKAIDTDEVKLIMDRARAQAERMPITRAAHDEAHAAEAGDAPEFAGQETPADEKKAAGASPDWS